MAKELTRKEKQITQLYIETLEDVNKNADNWISFLKRASYNYKYKFDEQILIYAQRPDAVACAETTIWNKKLKRWVNKGSKGIALITEKDGELGLRFVFDVSDTNSNVYGRKLKLWQAEEKYTDDIIEALEDRFGIMEDKSNLPLAIISTVYNHIVDNMQDYLEELKSVTTNSKLETLKPEELENSFLEILIYSTIALTMSRCGLDVNKYIGKDCFNEIEKFNTFETMCILGTATRDFSKEILLEISKTVINLEKQEKNKNYTFERLRKNIYNKENEKGSVENENNLQSERKLSNTRLDNRENKQESGTREISENETSIPKTEQEGNIHNASYEQQTNRPLDTNTGNSEKEDNRVSRTNEETVWNNRGIESEQPNGMGRTDEQYSSDSRADSNKRDNLQLEETQTEKEAENASFFDGNYTFMVGDVIHLGLDEFTIISLDNEKTTMYDNQFPLDQRTVVIKDIIPKIAENPLNDYLKDRETPKIEPKQENIFNNWLDTFIEEKGIDLEQQEQEAREFLNDLMTRDQRMFLGLITIVFTADTEKELENTTEAILTTARKNLCQFGLLKFQQLDGLNTTLPIGIEKIETLRTLTTESLAVFMPFKVQEVQHQNGIYYGQNAISKNMILLDRKQLLNGNSFILGVSGSGKSFTAKQEISSIILKEKNADVIIIDPENEFAGLVKELGGELVEISSTSKNHINAMDMNKFYGDNSNPIVLKSEFILSLCEQLMGKALEPQQRSVIDRCTANVYKEYQKRDYEGQPPTLKEFREELLRQNEKEAKDVALAIELFSNGSLNTFAKQTNVNINNRLVCYNILELKKQLQPIAMLVILDSIFNRITANREKGRNTYIYIDEIYLLFQYEYSANFLFTLWKRVRKYRSVLYSV